MRNTKIYIKVSLWNRLINELKKRGKGRRESGAFLLGPLHGNDVTDFVCYDDLHAATYDNGIIEFDSAGYDILWSICKKKKLKVHADIHTHPDIWTSQSETDKENPMIAQRGHVALIAPYYAMKKNQKLNGVGIFEYRGDHEWLDRTKTPNYIKLYRLWHWK